MNTPPEETHQHSVEVHIADPSAHGSLMKLVSVLHARGISVTDLRYTCLPDGAARMVADFEGTARQASTVRHSLRRCIYVTDATLSTAEPARVPTAVGL